MQRSHDGIAWRAIRRFGRTALGIVGYQPTEWWALAWVCVFRKALVSGINWSRKGSGYLRELTYSSLPRSSLYLSLSIHLIVSVSLARRLVGLRVQGNIGTRLYQSMSHSPPSPLHGSSCIASYTRLRLGQRYNPMARSLWLLSAFLIPEYLSTARINLVFYRPRRFLVAFIWFVRGSGVLSMNDTARRDAEINFFLVQMDNVFGGSHEIWPSSSASWLMCTVWLADHSTTLFLPPVSLDVAVKFVTGVQNVGKY